jgi:hypothetical protein
MPRVAFQKHKPINGGLTTYFLVYKGKKLWRTLSINLTFGPEKGSATIAYTTKSVDQQIENSDGMMEYIGVVLDYEERDYRYVEGVYLAGYCEKLEGLYSYKAIRRLGDFCNLIETDISFNLDS